jgi:hypothetical protein
MSHKHGQTADVLKKNSLGWEICKLMELEKNGASTVKSATHLIDEICNLRADSFSNLLWKGWMPLKMDVLIPLVNASR